MNALIAATALFAIVFLAVLAAMVTSMYKRCPPNSAMIICGGGIGSATDSQSGLPPKFRIITAGQGALVLPLVQSAAHISLETIAVPFLSHKLINTKDETKVSYDGAAQVKVINDPAAIAKFAEALLGKPESEVKEIVSNYANQSMISWIQKTNYSELIHDYGGIANRIKSDLSENLKEIGLTVLSVTVTRIQK